MDCLICRDLKRTLEFKRTEFFKARSAAYYQVSTKVAAYKQVEMERAKSNWEEHRLVCATATEARQAGAESLH
jgi:Zn-dependent peptidase ImmA (M78 family)